MEEGRSPPGPGEGEGPPTPPRRKTVHRKNTSSGGRAQGARAAQLFGGQTRAAASSQRRRAFVEEEIAYPDPDHALAHGYGLLAPQGSVRRGASNPALNAEAFEGDTFPPPILRRKSKIAVPPDRLDDEGRRTHGPRKPSYGSSDNFASVMRGEAASDVPRAASAGPIRVPSGTLTASLGRGKSVRETGGTYVSASPPTAVSGLQRSTTVGQSTFRSASPVRSDDLGDPDQSPMHYGIASPPAVGPPVLPAPPGPRRRQASGQRDPHIRRSSHDENFVTRPRSFYVDVEDVQRRLLAQEDRDGDFQITVTDRGPKVFPLNTAASGGYKKHEVRGTYMLSNLLQELALASDYGRKYIVVSEDRLSENPVERLHRMIKYYFWDELTRRIDADGLEIITDDPKNRSPGQHRRIYVPFRDKAAQQYYLRVAQERPRLGLEVEVLPEVITPRYVKGLDDRPGILSLALKTQVDGKTGQAVTRGVPFVVPGGRFNEMYGWDSYFETLGLLLDGRIELGKSMVDNFVYMIEHYNKILNANRSYYLTRSQPPFLTDMVLEVRKKLEQKPSYTQPELKRWLARCFRACVKELLSVWLAAPRLDPATGLSCYHTEGIGMPPETESSHFDHILEPYAHRHGMDVETFKAKYAAEEVDDPDLDEYFVHDRAVRESGHDTTYRFERKCADLATIDLNSLLYRYAMDVADVVRDDFRDCFRFRVRRGDDDANWKAFGRFREHLARAGTVEAALGDGAEWDSSWAQAIAVLDDLTDQAVLEIESWKLEQQRRRAEAEAQGGAQPNGVHEEAAAATGDGEERPKFPADLARDVSDAPIVWDAQLDHPDSPYFTVTATSSLFHLIARRIRQQVNKYNWNAKEGIFFDYNVREETQDVYETVTTLWALWGGLATPEQAQRVVNETKRRFEVVGGLVAGTEESRGRVGLDRPNRQWDYPYGWAPHQMLAWAGCAKYGMREIGERWAYRWLYTITKSFVDFNGVVPEKFDVVNMTHKVNVEYGNVGTDFKFIPREGFGWMNSSFVVGLEYLRPAWKRALAIVTDPDTLFYRTEKRNREKLLREAAEKERMEQEAAARAKKEGDSV